MNTELVKRVYHLLPANWALCDIRHRRLKVTTFDDVNDPFELLGINLREKNIREKVKRWREEIKAEYGMLCFSAGWKSPLLWSHYADKHKGICLGFDVPQDLLHKVEYRQNRLPHDCVSLKVGIEPVLWMKFRQWKYEAEHRCIVSLDRCNRENVENKAIYFWPFGGDLKLQEVVCGARCEIDKKQLKMALGSLAKSVNLIKAREAFGSFKVVTQQGRYWY